MTDSTECKLDNHNYSIIVGQTALGRKRVMCSKCGDVR